MTNKFDIDLQYGQVREKRLADMLSNDKIEVKTERDIWKTTGNIAIEYKCKGKPSGIAVTEAKWWAHVLLHAVVSNRQIKRTRTKTYGQKKKRRR